MKKWILLYALFISSCTTLTERGYEALEAGRTEEALQLFENAVQKKDEPQAREGLRRAQQQWIERKLIDVRLLRLAENAGGSENLLKEIIQKQNVWQAFPTGAAYSTQMEEVRLYSDRVKNRITLAIQQKNPLLAQSEFNQHQFILNRSLSQNTAALQNQIFKEAEDLCNQELKHIKNSDYFKHIWLKQTCQIWGVPLKEKKTQSSVKFFKNLIPSFEVQGLDPATTDVLSQHLKNSFQRSRWYKTDGIYDLKSDFQGAFKEDLKENDVFRSATYYVDVPYEESYKRVRDEKKNNSGAVSSLLNLLFVGSPSERVTNNSDGTETVYVTKYRKERRDYPYKAIEVRASKALTGDIVYSLDQQNLSFKISENWNLREDRHNENFRDAGLVPSNPVIPSKAQWVSSLGDSLMQKLTDSLQLEWVNRFCNSLTTKKSSDVGYDELVHRCGYQINGAIPEVLNQYYMEKWKLSFKDYQALLASSDFLRKKSD